MKTVLKSALLAFTVVFASCSNDDNNTTTTGPETAETITVRNLYAPQSGSQGENTGGSYTKFSFSENSIVTGDNWDIAFRGTSIIVNGGTAITVGSTEEPARVGQGAATVIAGTFASVTEVPAASTFAQDAANTPAISGWYTYNIDTHIITANAGKIYVIKTHDGKYAKMEIQSYYKDAVTNPDLNTEYRYYTFKYAYKADDNTTF